MQFQKIRFSAIAFFLSTVVMLNAGDTHTDAVTLPPLAQTSSSGRKVETNQQLALIGTKELKIQIIKGAQWGTESTQRMFTGATWIFSSDGKFTFTPSPEANVRSDLYPLSGTYTKTNGLIELRGERVSSSASASLDGAIAINGDSMILDIIYTVTALDSQKIAKITQNLSQQTQTTTKKTVTEIEGIPVPSTFKISIQGKTEAQEFSSLSGTLQITPPQKGEPNPFSVTLTTDKLDENGSVFWSSFVPSATGGEVSSQAIASKGRVSLSVREQQSMQVGVTWFTLTQGSLVPGLPVGVSAKRGTLSFSIQDNNISGTIQAEGISDFNQPSTYQARFVGRSKNSQQLKNSSEKSLGSETQTNFSGTWNAEEFGQIKLQQEGKKVSGTYTGRGGGTITGTIEGNRLDFIWKDNRKGEGWGFVRVISGGRTLTGLWGDKTNKTKSFSLIATQEIVQTPRKVTSQDRQELKYLGYDLVLQGKCIQGIEPLEKALTLYKQERGNQKTYQLIRDTYLIDEVNILTRLSHCYHKLSDYKKLLQSFRYAAEVRDLLREIEYLQGIPIEKSDPLQKSLDVFFNDWKTTLISDLEKINFLDKGQPFFQTLTSLLVESGNEKEALVVSEKGRARALIDLLAGRINQSTVNLPTLQQILQTAQKQKATLVEYSIINDDSGKESKLYIWVVKPTGEVEFKSVDLKSLVQNNTTLVDLVYRSRESIGVTLSGRGTEKIPFKVGDRVEFQDDEPDWEPWEVVGVDIKNGTLLVRQPLFGTNKPISRSISEVAGKKDTSLQQLHQILIEPITHILPKNERERIIFIPQSVLFTVPFGALQDSSGNYLIAKHTILTAPSIQTLDSTYKIRQSLQPIRQFPLKPQEALVVGNPNPMPLSLKPLEYAEAEAKEIASLLNTKEIINTDATEAAIVSKIEQARIIHLATHGIFDNERGLGSYIALAPSGDKDGLLTAEKILDLQLKAELVVLSACDTGRGRITGDGVVGLSRSLMSVGVPSVVVSLWKVPDEATKMLMTEFYRQMPKQPDKATALREAMLKTMQKYPLPINWAAFTLIGEAQ